MKNVTIITLLVFLSLNLKAQILTETFESGLFPPTGWATMEEAGDPDDAIDIEWMLQDDFEPAYNSYGWAHTGNYAAISSFGMWDTYESWLITPQFTPTDDNHVLHFFAKQAYADDYESQFIIKVSTSAQDAYSDFVTLLTIEEADAPRIYTEYTVDLSEYIGTPVYIAFINYDADGDGEEWYVDDITMEPIPVPGPTLNPYPANGATDVVITNTQTSEIGLSWEAPQTGGEVYQYDLWFGTQPDQLRLLGHPADLAAHPKTFHFNTTYYWKAAAVNMSGESSDIWSFTTCDFPTLPAPYYVDFENEGYVPDGMDQSVENGNKFWHFTNDINTTGHLGNAGDTNGTETPSGGYFAFVSDLGSPSPNGTVMYSAKVDISSLTTPAISVYILSNNEGSLNVTYHIDAFDGSDWVTVFTNNANTNGWEQKTVDLTGFNLPDVTQFRFVVTEPSGSDNHDDFAMDDFTVDELSNLLSNTEFTLDNIKVYPNPVVNTLYVSLTNHEVPAKLELFDLTGKLLLNVTESGQLDMSNLPKGEYLLQVYNKHNESFTQKIIK